MIEWLKKVFSKILNSDIKLHNNNLGLVNANADIKADVRLADKIQDNKLVEVNNNDNSKHLVINNGMSYSDISKFVEDKLKEANSNLMKNLEPRLLPQDYERLNKDYDFLSTYREALQISAKRNDETTDSLLTEIIEERIKSTDELFNIVNNESIITIGKLTKSQIEILYLLALSHHTSLGGEKESILKGIKETYFSLFNKNFNRDDFDHLAYTGCIDIQNSMSYKFNDIIYSLLKNEDLVRDIQNSTEYIFAKEKWENSYLKHSKLTTVGKNIGLNYHKVCSNINIAGFDKLFGREEA